MTEPVLPVPPGLGWSVIKAPRFKTRMQNAVSGRQLRVADQQYPIWTWTLTYDLLRDSHDIRTTGGRGASFDELRTLMGFWAARQGSFGTFLYDDPSDNRTTGETIGTGNGSRTQFQMVRALAGSGFFEPITAPLIVSAIYDNGVSQLTGWSVAPLTGVLTFITPPANTHVITADFTYRWRCHFAEDSSEWDNFMFQLWQMKQLKFESVLP